MRSMSIRAVPRNRGAGRNLAPHAVDALFRFTLALIRGGLSSLTAGYWPAAGDTTLGVASVLLLLGALVPDVELLFVPFGKPEFGGLLAMPLSELVAPGVP